MIVEEWVKKHQDVYIAATRHSFIKTIRDASIDISSFNRWLSQDYLFVRKFIPFVASVLVKACQESDDESDVEIILAAMASLNDEIAWFKKEASKRSIDLTSITPQETNLKYCRFLERLVQPDINYAVAMTALWAIEVVYQQSFAHCLEDDAKTPLELREACERWGNAGFGEYCETLKKITNRCLAKSSGDVCTKSEATFLQVLEEEVDFWNMSQGTV